MRLCIVTSFSECIISSLHRPAILFVVFLFLFFLPSPRTPHRSRPKVRHARGGPKRCVAVFDRGRGPRACGVTVLKHFSYIIMKPKIESDVQLSVVTDIF